MQWSITEEHHTLTSYNREKPMYKAIVKKHNLEHNNFKALL